MPKCFCIDSELTEYRVGTLISPCNSDWVNKYGVEVGTPDRFVPEKVAGFSEVSRYKAFTIAEMYRMIEDKPGRKPIHRMLWWNGIDWEEIQSCSTILTEDQLEKRREAIAAFDSWLGLDKNE